MPQHNADSDQQSLKQMIYRDLKEKLIRCVYTPGSQLNEIALTEEYGVSRTPVREAISRLELEGYLKVIPKKGICISNVTIQDALQIFQTRYEIEPLTLKLSIPYLNMEKLMNFRDFFRRDQEYLWETFDMDMSMHLYLIDQCRNNYLIKMMHRLFDDNKRVAIFTGQNEVKIHNARCEHLAILDSLIAMQDPEHCADLMRSHIQTCRTAALHYFGSDKYRNRGVEGT